MPVQIQAATVTAIQDGSDTIPTDGFASITYEGDQWTYEGDTYYIIDRDAEPEPTPTPTPTPDPAPTPDPDQPADDATVPEWLKAIFLQLVGLNNVCLNYLGLIHNDLYDLNQLIKDNAFGGSLNATDPDAQQSALTNFFAGFLEFIKAALVPTQELNLEGLQKMPENIGDKFPFCLPADAARLVGILSADVKHPDFKFVIPLSYVGYSDIDYNVDLTKFNEVAQVIRTGLLIAFVIGLIWKSASLIGIGGGGDDD
ncbi:MAG: hypothetical protein ACRC26_01645 [Bacteroidales bacterium]